MQNSSNAVGGALTPLGAKINNPKTVHITPAKNGFVVQLQRLDEYGQDYAIASSVEDITKIINDYFN